MLLAPSSASITTRAFSAEGLHFSVFHFFLFGASSHPYISLHSEEMIFPLVSLPAPDPPDHLSQYSMIPGSDYAQQIIAVNATDDFLIHEFRKIICYNQTIYDDLRLEMNEYAGLTLGVEYNQQTTVLTFVKDVYDQSSILILDNDSEL